MANQPHLPALQQAARYRTLRRTLRSAAIGLFIFGALAIISGGLALSLRAGAANAILAFLGVALLALGALNLAAPRPALQLANGVALVLLAGWNIVASIANSMDGGRLNLAWVAVFQLIWGIAWIKRYREYRAVDQTPPPADMLQWLDATAQAIRGTTPGASPYVIEWSANRGPWNSSRWRAQLVDDLATAVDGSGAELLLVPRDQFNIARGKKVMLSRQTRVTVRLGDISMNGLMAADQLERFQNWRWAGAGAPGQGLWVPPA